MSSGEEVHTGSTFAGLLIASIGLYAYLVDAEIEFAALCLILLMVLGISSKYISRKY